MNAEKGGDEYYNLFLIYFRVEGRIYNFGAKTHD